MIEEIKKEILLIHSSCQCNSCKTIDEEIKKQAFEILDKYKDKEDKYKNAWEELKLMVNAVAFDKVRTTMRDLETKNGIEVK